MLIRIGVEKMRTREIRNLPKIRLEILSGKSKGYAVIFSSGPIRIGSARDNDLVLISPYVSKYHGWIDIHGSRLFYHDNFSLNGSIIIRSGKKFSSGDQVYFQQELLDGDRIILGNIEVGVRISMKGGSFISLKNINYNLDRTTELKIRGYGEEKAFNFERIGRHLTGFYSAIFPCNDSEELCLEISSYILNLFEMATIGGVVVFEGEGERIFGLSRDEPSGHDAIVLSRTIVSTIRKSPTASLYSSVKKHFSKVKSVKFLKIDSAIYAPLIIQDDYFGFLFAESRIPGRKFSKRELDLMVNISLAASHIVAYFLSVEREKRTFQKSVEALFFIVDFLDKMTSDHCFRVKNLALGLGSFLGVVNQDLEVLEYSALLHDIGKIFIDKEILHKSGQLSEEELNQIRKHEYYSFSLLDRINFPPGLTSVPEITRLHHERYDGSGKEGLKGNDIPLLSRIITLVDIFDAVNSHRPYKDELSLQETLRILKSMSGKEIDPHLFDAFLKANHLTQLTE